MRIPFCAPTPVPTITAVGVASPKAQVHTQHWYCTTESKLNHNFMFIVEFGLNWKKKKKKRLKAVPTKCQRILWEASVIKGKTSPSIYFLLQRESFFHPGISNHSLYNRSIEKPNFSQIYFFSKVKWILKCKYKLVLYESSLKFIAVFHLNQELI